VRTFSAPVAMTVCEKSCRVAIVLKNHSMEPRHQRRVLASGIAERLGTDGAGLKLVDLAQKRHDEESPMADHRSALLRIIELLTKSGRFGVKAIGHRIVHGGEYFQEAVIVTEDVIENIEELARLGPPPQSAQYPIDDGHAQR